MNKSTQHFLNFAAKQPRLIGIFSGALFGCLAILLCTLSTESLDYTQFLAIPFFVGGFSILISNICNPEKRNALQTIGTSISSVILCSILVFSTGLDGLFCLLLSGPLSITAAVCGGFLSSKLAESFPKQGFQNTALLAFTLLVPLLMGFESRSHHTPNLRRVVSTIEIEAEPEEVWKNVIEYPQIESKLDFFFSAGVAYPISSSIVSPEQGSTRSTLFSTGVAEQRISTYQKNSLLIFDIVKSPDSLIELSPFDGIGNRHLEKTMKPRAGKIRLTPLDNGKSELEYSLYYYQGLWPQSYWSTVTDIAVTRIQKRIMDHIKTLSEKPETGFLAEIAENQ